MERAEAVIAGKVKALRKELAEKRRAERAYEAAFGTSGAAADRGLAAGSPLYNPLSGQAGAHPDTWFWTPAHLQTPARPSPRDPEQATQTGAEVSQHSARLGAIHELEAQITVLEDLRMTLHQPPAKNGAHVVVSRERAKRSSKQNPWLTVTSCGVYLVLGWLLSVLGSPVTVLHALVR